AGVWVACEMGYTGVRRERKGLWGLGATSRVNMCLGGRIEGQGEGLELGRDVYG
ncbi:unnamed protein product, partial [Dovyalis caffra]